MSKIPSKLAILLVSIALLIILDVATKSPETPNVKTILIKEGMRISEINDILHRENILKEDDDIPFSYEGYLFPDTYDFFVHSSKEIVIQKMEDNFNKKVDGVIPEGADKNRVITVASIIQKEVVGRESMQLVAGIIEKRLKSNYPLQIDATTCYLKPVPCKLERGDLQTDSPYNTYLHKGLPPTPISNPGLEAILASTAPMQSEYWFYITDPKTKKTIFSKDLGDHQINVAKYLR